MAYIQKECPDCELIYSFDEENEIKCPRCNEKPLTMDEVEGLLSIIPETDLNESISEFIDDESVSELEEPANGSTIE